MKNTLMRYYHPAAEWTDALMLGNGRVGAMVYGSAVERLQFNEESLWSGWHDEFADNPDCAAHLDEIRRELFAGNIVETERLTQKYLVCRGEGSHSGHGYGHAYGSFESAGEMYIDFGHESGMTEYSRELDILRGEARTEYTALGKRFSRVAFVSPEQNCFVMRVAADGEFDAEFSYQREKSDIKYTDGGILMTGVFDKGIGYAGAVRIVTDGDTHAQDSSLSVKSANYINIYVSIATGYKYDLAALEQDSNLTAATALAAVERASSPDFDIVRAETNRHFETLMSRAAIDTGAPDYDGKLGIDERLALLKSGERDSCGLDSLIELFWQLGRYLLISSSYNCKLPANLQGVWSGDYDTIWSADYHININLQMNYWLAETTNLAECCDSLMEYIKFISEKGKSTAKTQYDCHGWVAHTITNPWGFTAPGESCSWGSFMCGGAWCCEHIWEHYRFTLDREFLIQYYPVMRGACEFFLDFLCEDPNTGYLVTAPSNSPENHYFDPATGKVVAICAGPTMDNCILRELFTNTSAAAEILGIDSDFADKLSATCDRLPPIKIGARGQIMEWQQDFEEAEPGHRHLSMLYGLHPSNQITKTRTPELFEAAKTAIALRLEQGGGHTGWSRAWIINFYARLAMGDECLKHIELLLERSTYNNLFDAHPPFQIDGNFGFTAGIAEMLMQSHDGAIELLPALPEKWKTGSFKGLRARGDITVSCEWESRKARRCELVCGHDCKVRLRYDSCEREVELAAGATKIVEF